MGMFEEYVQELSEQVTKVVKHQPGYQGNNNVKIWFDTDEDSWNMKISNDIWYRMFWRTRDIGELSAGAVRFISMIQYAEDMSEYNATTEILKMYCIEEMI